MKKLLQITYTIIVATTIVTAQDINNEIFETIASSEFESNYEVVVKNINGKLEIEGYEGDEIQITGERELWKEQGDISESEANDYQLKWLTEDGFIFIYVDAPGVEIDFYDGRIDYNMHWNDRRTDRVSFNFDLKIKVPRSMDIDASTINGGDLIIENMNAEIEANNVNGSVKVIDATTHTEANTVNGDIEVWFAKSPSTNMDFHTVNGSIDIYSPKDFGAIVTFESLHGELYTDFDNVKRLPNQLNRAEGRRNNHYRISSNAPIQIGEGGPSMNFKLVNGSVYIRERES